MLWFVIFAALLPILAVVSDGVYSVLYAKIKETVRAVKRTVSKNKNSAVREETDLYPEYIKKAS